MDRVTVRDRSYPYRYTLAILISRPGDGKREKALRDYWSAKREDQREKYVHLGGRETWQAPLPSLIEIYQFFSCESCDESDSCGSGTVFTSRKRFRGAKIAFGQA